MAVAPVAAVYITLSPLQGLLCAPSILSVPCAHLWINNAQCQPLISCHFNNTSSNACLEQQIKAGSQGSMTFTRNLKSAVNAFTKDGRICISKITIRQPLVLIECIVLVLCNSISRNCDCSVWSFLHYFCSASSAIG